MNPKIGVISGTGIYHSAIFENTEITEVETPYGIPSDKIKIGKIGNTPVALLPRHGIKHNIPPHRINFKANIYAFKKLGVEKIIATAAVGSLKEEYRPGDIVFPDSFIDFGKDHLTYYDGPDVRHVSLADPFCGTLRELLSEVTNSLKIGFHDKGTYLRVSGPRFSTRAESRMFQNQADIIGMTAIPEAILARELGICYAVIATVTDYDCWKEQAVNAKLVMETMKANVNKTEKIIQNIIPKIPFEKCECKLAPDQGKIS